MLAGLRSWWMMGGLHWCRKPRPRSTSSEICRLALSARARWRCWKSRSWRLPPGIHSSKMKRSEVVMAAPMNITMLGWRSVRSISISDRMASLSFPLLLLLHCFTATGVLLHSP
eukprot:scaffold7351_cov259-Pinguiococcus_pyrenoidosus.AAC.9